MDYCSKTSAYSAGKTTLLENVFTCENITFVAVGIHHLDLERGRRDLSAGGNCLIVTNCRMFLKEKNIFKILFTFLKCYRGARKQDPVTVHH